MAGRPGRAPVLVLAALLAGAGRAACSAFPGQRGGAHTAEIRPHGAPRATAAQQGQATAAVVAADGTATKIRREARPIAALDAADPAAPAGPAPTPAAATPVMRWAWSAPGPAPETAPPAGWVHVTPHEQSQHKPQHPEDTAFLYYQFEPLEVRGGGHVVEIAELEILNNGERVDLSGATASTPSGLANLGGLPASLLIDGNISSVWADDALEPVTVQLPQPASADGFGFITGAVPDRDPARWVFRGSADGQRWTTLQSQAQGYRPGAKRLELQSFVFGETAPEAPTAAPAAQASTPTEVAGAGTTAAGATGAGAAGADAAAAALDPPAGEQAAGASESLLNTSWSPADDRVTAESAAASRQAVVESAERRFEEAAGESQRKKDEEGSSDAALTASLSTLGVLLLLAAGAAFAYNVYFARPAAVPPGKGDQLLSDGEEDDRDVAPGNPTGTVSDDL